MSIREMIRDFADNTFTSDDRYTWYDLVWDKIEMRKWPGREEEQRKAQIRARDFFEANWERVEKVKSILCDEKSRRIYEGIIRFNMTGDRKYHPGSDRNQYFPADVVRLSDEEVFVDCGGYTADTTQDFIRRVGGYRRIVLFEPDPLLEKQIKQNISGYNAIVYIQKGVYSKTGKLLFSSDGSSGGSVIKEGRESVPENVVGIDVTKIDDIAECADATYIKMDLEGSEWDALHGAEQTILRQKPKLGICIYHSNEDRLRLIEYIHELVPEYKLYVRQHTKQGHETVVYAIKD